MRAGRADNDTVNLLASFPLRDKEKCDGADNVVCLPDRSGHDRDRERTIFYWMCSRPSPKSFRLRIWRRTREPSWGRYDPDYLKTTANKQLDRVPSKLHAPSVVWPCFWRTVGVPR